LTILNISGEWTGVYDYPDNESDAVPFKATVSDMDGLVSGSIIEPNTFVEDGNTELFSVINGKRDGLYITFLKIYESSEYTDSYEIIYEGTLTKDMTVIQGTWKTTDDMTWSGPFVMNRAAKIEIKREQKIEEDITLR
jgi:hypothetical protein